MQTSILQDLFIANPILSAAYDQLQRKVNKYLPDPATTQCQYLTKTSKQSKTSGRVYSIMNKLGRKADSISQEFHEHVRLAPKILFGKLEKVFNQFFSVREGEILFKVSHCYLSTTSGPLAGLLFISTDKVAFCSERSIKAFNGKGQMIRTHYKVVIPLEKIKCVNQRENVEKPKRKYMEIVTKDNFDFWFMGITNCHKTFKYLDQAICQA